MERPLHCTPAQSVPRKREGTDIKVTLQRQKQRLKGEITCWRSRIESQGLTPGLCSHITQELHSRTKQSYLPYKEEDIWEHQRLARSRCSIFVICFMGPK